MPSACEGLMLDSVNTLAALFMLSMLGGGKEEKKLIIGVLFQFLFLLDERRILFFISSSLVSTTADLVSFPHGLIPGINLFLGCLIKTQKDPSKSGLRPNLDLFSSDRWKTPIRFQLQIIVGPFFSAPESDPWHFASETQQKILCAVCIAMGENQAPITRHQKQYARCICSGPGTKPPLPDTRKIFPNSGGRNSTGGLCPGALFSLCSLQSCFLARKGLIRNHQALLAPCHTVHNPHPPPKSLVGPLTRGLRITAQNSASSPSRSKSSSTFFPRPGVVFSKSRGREK